MTDTINGWGNTWIPAGRGSEIWSKVSRKKKKKKTFTGIGYVGPLSGNTFLP